MPDLSADWFVNAYRVSFATAIFVAVALLIPQAIRTARGHQAGRDLVESMGVYFGLFLAGAIFGPAMGLVLVNFFHSLSRVFVRWGIEGSVDGVIAQFQRMLSEADPVGMTGGVPIAVLLMFCMLIGLFLVLLMLVVQLVTLYFTGVLIPLGLVWIIDPTRRSFGMKLVALWIGILAAHPLLFFLLGFAFTMMSNAVGTFGNNLSLQTLVTFLVAIIALFVAALSPMLLLKFAPVIPTGFGGTTGPSLNTPTIGASNLTDVANRLRDSRATPKSSVSTASAEPPADATGDSAAPEWQPSLADVAYARSQAPSAPKSSPATRSANPVTPAAAEADATAAPAAAPAAATPALAGATSTAGAAAPGTAAAGTATAGSAAAGSAATGTAAAGAAASSTGVGAVIGVPALLAAAGLAATAKGADLAGKAGQQAARSMDDRPRDTRS
ncbi:hypothetical protein [Marisediminicola senii]|uniref:hypothetical protein n=1 Tax=Marisediminicola senii TaxID=2711233 RepID=UPI0013EB88C1|nr:hypothetical protein [Marisediminicola senii]